MPGAVPGPDAVHGELFRIEDLDVLGRLDRYEGYDPAGASSSLFVRRAVSLEAPPKTAWVYWYNDDPETAPPVPSGDWAVHVARDRS